MFSESNPLGANSNNIFLVISLVTLPNKSARLGSVYKLSMNFLYNAEFSEMLSRGTSCFNIFRFRGIIPKSIKLYISIVFGL